MNRQTEVNKKKMNDSGIGLDGWGDYYDSKMENTYDTYYDTYYYSHDTQNNTKYNSLVLGVGIVAYFLYIHFFLKWMGHLIKKNN